MIIKISSHSQLIPCESSARNSSPLSVGVRQHWIWDSSILLWYFELGCLCQTSIFLQEFLRPHLPLFKMLPSPPWIRLVVTGASPSIPQWSCLSLCYSLQIPHPNVSNLQCSSPQCPSKITFPWPIFLHTHHKYDWNYLYLILSPPSVLTHYLIYPQVPSFLKWTRIFWKWFHWQLSNEPF